MTTRINVYRYPAADEFDSETTLSGWFDQDRAAKFDEATDWDGNNQISQATGTQWDHQCLYRTAGARWVLHSWSQWQGSLPRYEFVTDEQAHIWLMRNEHDAAAEQHFGPVDEERGPGRPEVGPAVHVRLAANTLQQVDTRAVDAGMSRAEMVRQLVTAGLAANKQA